MQDALKRETTRLSSVQDLIGFRVVVRGAVEQEALAVYFSALEDWRLIDRRQNPRHGYRAVHLIRRGEIGSVEVQLRTRLQHQWAELSERHERISPGVKYGQGDASVQDLLQRASDLIATMEDLELQMFREAAPPDFQQQLGRLRHQLINSIERAIQSLSKEEGP